MIGMKPLGPLAWVAIVVAVIVGLYFAGGLVARRSITVGGCRAEWDTIARSVRSELCPDPNVTCTAEPYIMQHNAIVDALLCACAKAAPDYANDDLNAEIAETYRANTNITLTAREICEGGQLAKWTYG
jgi:hypothetical protein